MILLSLAIIFLIIFLILAFFVHQQKKLKIDQLIYQIVNKRINSKRTKRNKIITWMGGTYGIVLFMILFTILLHNKKDAIFIVLAMFFVVLLNYILKRIFKRLRPTIHPLIKQTGFSFPSGHAMASTAFYGLIIFFILPLMGPLKYIIIPFCIIIIPLILYSRVYLGVHYFSDVLAGMFCSLSYLFFIFYIYQTFLSLSL